MKIAQDHPQEKKRFDTLKNYEVLDTPQELQFDELTELASALCSTPMSLISLIDDRRQWFKSRVGLDANETPKEIAFCSHAILQDNVFEITDAAEDERFSDNPLVTGNPDIRFYAGAPLVAPNGMPIGTLCVIDTKPKVLTADQKRALKILSNQVISQLELRKQTIELERNYNQQQTMISSIAHDLKSPFNGILGLSDQLSNNAQLLPPETIAKLSQHILSSSMLVHQTLDEMLQWTSQRVCGNQVSLQKHPLLELVQSSFQLLEQALALKSIHFDCTVRANKHVYADAIMTQSIIRNLLNNAIKFTPDGGNIIVSSTTTGNKVILQITNSGDVICEENCKKLFTNKINSKEGTCGESGTGFGLSLCKEFIDAQDGEIWYEPTETGPRFAFSLRQAS